MSLPASLAELAVSMYHNPGVYALLLGSGMSRGANVPTAWGIVEDLVRKLATTHGVHPPPEGDALIKWYEDTFQSSPDYSDLIERLEPKVPGQRNMLRGYFEQKNDAGESVPTPPSAAHQAVARLCQAGYIRVILTTNFDRLMEHALREVGIEPTVISNEAELAAAPPLVHGGVTIIKLHGDYLKDDVRNSAGDLLTYPPAWSDYLNRVLDEFGLIVCGWSGDYDAALRQAILETVNRRYSLFWSAYSQPSIRAAELIAFRQGRVITGFDADHFFGALESRVLALRDLNWTPPQDGLALSAEVKRHLANPALYGVRLTDLIEGTCDDLDRALDVPLAVDPDTNLSAALDWAVNVTTPLLHIIGTLMKYDREARWLPTLREGLLRVNWDKNLKVNETGLAAQVRRLPLQLVALAVAGLGVTYHHVEAITFLREDRHRKPNHQRYSPIELLSHTGTLEDVLNKQHQQVWLWRGAVLRYVLIERLSPVIGRYFRPGTMTDDIQVGELILSFLSLDLTLDQPVGHLEQFVLPGTHLYGLPPKRAATKFQELFGDRLERLATQLHSRHAVELVVAYDDFASRIVASNAISKGTQGSLQELFRMGRIDVKSI